MNGLPRPVAPIRRFPAVFLVILSLASLCPTLEIQAQPPTPLSSLTGGSAVRVEAEALGPGYRVGTFLRSIADSVELRLGGPGGGEVLFLPVRGIGRMEVALGKTRAQGSLIGAGVGLIALGGRELLVCNGKCFTTGNEGYTAGVFLAAALGAAAGALIGSRVLARTRWGAVNLGVGPNGPGPRARPQPSVGTGSFARR